MKPCGYIANRFSEDVACCLANAPLVFRACGGHQQRSCMLLQKHILNFKTLRRLVKPVASNIFRGEGGALAEGLDNLRSTPIVKIFFQ